MPNPFVYGLVVTGPDFVDREPELRDLGTHIRSGKSVVIYSNRRMGKSSLLAEMIRRRKGDFAFVYIDTYGVTEVEKFLETFAQEVTRSSASRARRMLSSVTELLRGTGLRMVLTGSGEVAVELATSRPRHDEMREVFDLPERVAKMNKKRMVIVIDEFQDLLGVGGVPLIKTMRASFQTHKDVVYVFSGSKRHMLMSIFEEGEGAFYRFARPMSLGPIPADDFEGYLVRKYASAGGHLGAAVARRVVEAGEGYPYYVQHVAYELFQISLEPSLEDVASAVQSTVDHQSHAFMNIWESVRSQLHRRYLLAVAREPDAPQGVSFIARHNLRSVSHLHRARTQLEKKGLLERGRLVDPFFAMWLRRSEAAGTSLGPAGR